MSDQDKKLAYQKATDRYRQLCKSLRKEALNIRELEKELQISRRNHFPMPEVNAEELRIVLSGVVDVIEDTIGVAGWYLNGEFAEWGEFNYPQELINVLEKC